MATVIRFSIYLVMALCSSLAAAQSCDYYASPSGGGNGLSSSSPFQVADFWSHAEAGTTLCLLDGTYRGARSMLLPPQNIHGAPGAPITVQAMNDGKVLFDGEYQNIVVQLYRNNYWTLKGFNAAHGPIDSNSVIAIAASNYATVQRVGAWDSYDSGIQTPDTPNLSNNSVWSISGSSYGLYEDIFGFGSGRYIMVIIGYNGPADHNIVRRFWGRFDRQVSTFSNPRAIIHPNYDAWYNLIENMIGVWAPTQMTGGGCCIWGIGNGAGTGYGENHESPSTRIVGSLAYMSPAAVVGMGGLFTGVDVNMFHFKDITAVIPPGSDSLTVALYNPSFYSNLTAPYDVGITNALLIGGTKIIQSDWQPTNVESYSSVSEATGSGVDPYKYLRYRYIDGVKTSQSLWPWPMNQRILDATRMSGYKVADVMADVAAVLGPVPNLGTPAPAPSPTPTPTPAPSPTPSPILNPVISVSDVKVLPGASVTVKVSDGAMNPQEWVGLFEAARPDSAYTFDGNWKYLNGSQVQPSSGVSSATLTFVMPTTLGFYNFRYFAKNGIDNRLALSSNIEVVDQIPKPAITLSTTQALPGEAIKVSVSGGNSGVQEWVALNRASDDASAYSFEGNWQYLDGTKTAPASGLSSATLTFIMPSTPGIYQFRYYANNGISNRLAVSGNITTSVLVVPKVTVSATQVLPGANVSVSVSGGKGGAREWIGLYVAANPDSAYSACSTCWKYLNGLQTAPATGLSSTTLTFQAPSTPGTYNFRYFATDGISNRLAISQNFTITVSTVAVPTPTPSPTPSPVPSPVISVSAAKVLPGASVTVKVSGGTMNPQEWVGLFEAARPDSAYTFNGNWKYLNGSQVQPSSGVSSATLTFIMPTTPGIYNFRYFAKNGIDNRLALSTNIEVAAQPPQPAITLSATQALPGATIQVSVSGGNGGVQEWVALYDAAKPDSAYSVNGNWQYLNGTKTEPLVGLSSATLNFVMPTSPGTYNFRYFAYDGYGQRLAISFNITVSQFVTMSRNRSSSPLLRSGF